MSDEQQLLQAIFHLLGRQAFSETKLRETVIPRKSGGSSKQLEAYNLCGGTKTQADIAKEAGLDPGNFNRTLSKWISTGIVVCLGEGRGAKLLHIYPLDD